MYQGDIYGENAALRRDRQAQIDAAAERAGREQAIQAIKEAEVEKQQAAEELMVQKIREGQAMKAGERSAKAEIAQKLAQAQAIKQMQAQGGLGGGQLPQIVAQAEEDPFQSMNTEWIDSQPRQPLPQMGSGIPGEADGSPINPTGPIQRQPQPNPNAPGFTPNPIITPEAKVAILNRKIQQASPASQQSQAIMAELIGANQQG